MTTDLLPQGNSLQLTSFFEDYQKLEQNFKKGIFKSIKSYFPVDFDMRLLNLEDLIAKIKLDDYGTINLANIQGFDYDGSVVELYKHIEPLNGVILDGFEIVVQRDNFNFSDSNLHVVKVILKKLDDTIEGKYKQKDLFTHPTTSSLTLEILGEGQ